MAPAGQRIQSIYEARFNIQGADEVILRAEMAPDAAQQDTPDKSFGVYLRNLFFPNLMYCFAGLNGDRFILVGERKTFAKKGSAVPDGVEIGRALSVAFFDKVSISADGLFVRPESAQGELELAKFTLAELMAVLGYGLPDAHASTARENEINYERALLGLDVVVYADTRRLGTYDEPWSFMLSDPQPVEEYFRFCTPLHTRNKMALVGEIQERDGFNDDVRNRLWQLTWHVLLEALLGIDAGAGGDICMIEHNDHLTKTVLKSNRLYTL